MKLLFFVKWANIAIYSLCNTLCKKKQHKSVHMVPFQSHAERTSIAHLCTHNIYIRHQPSGSTPHSDVNCRAVAHTYFKSEPS